MTVLTKKNCTKVNSEQIHELHISKSWSSDDIPREPEILLKISKEINLHGLEPFRIELIHLWTRQPP